VTRILLTPASALVASHGRQQFFAVALDQFGNALAAQPLFSWSLTTGVGRITSAGLYLAPRTSRGVAVVEATADGLSATATVNIGRRQASRLGHHARPARRSSRPPALPDPFAPTM
jgi:hypothetical protein